MGGLIGGLFGGGGDSGSSQQPASEQLQQNNEMLSYQDPNSAVQDYQNKYVQSDQPKTLTNTYQENPKKKKSNSFGKQWGQQHGLASLFFMGDD